MINPEAPSPYEDAIAEAEAEPTLEDLAGELKKAYRERIEASKELPPREKKILIIDCNQGKPDPKTGTCFNTRTITLADERLNSTNTTAVIPAQGQEFPDSFEHIAGVIISGSTANIGRWRKTGEPEWVGKAEEFVKKAMDEKIPILGICFGMQMVADIKGRAVPRNVGGYSKGAWKTSLFLDSDKTEHPIFKGFQFQYSSDGHHASALMPTIGAHNFRVEQGSSEENIHGYSYPERVFDFDHLNTDVVNDRANGAIDTNVASPMVEIDDNYIGVQFHPELATPLCIKYQKATLDREETKEQVLKSGQTIEEVKAGLDAYPVGDENDSRKIVSNFVDICGVE